MMAKTIVPENLKNLLGRYEATTLTIVTAYTIKKTYAVIQTDTTEFELLETVASLSMGAPAVAPMSNITLAFIECKKLGWETANKYMRRLIDDIVINTDHIDPDKLKSMYPRYLTLNDGTPNVYLDVQFNWDNHRGKFVTYPYIKPFGIIPLNWESNHPIHTKTAIAKNELRRLWRLCSEDHYREDWTEYWRTKFLKADYPAKTLRKIQKDLENGEGTWTRKREENLMIHMAKWRGTDIHHKRMIDHPNLLTAWRRGGVAVGTLMTNRTSTTLKWR
jgi:hypothetical protein